MLRTLLKPALTGPLDRVHLAGYHAGALDGVPAEWRALSEHALNKGQEETLKLVARGGNVLSRQPTGSGKSYCYLLPALAKWAAVARARSACADESTRTKLPLPPLVMVVAPFRDLCKDAERQAGFLIHRLYEDGLLPTVDVLGQHARARALFVDRGEGETADLGVASTFAASADSLDAAEMLPSSPRRNVAGSRSQPASPPQHAVRVVRMSAKRSPSQIAASPPVVVPPFPSLEVESPSRRLSSAARRVFSRM